MVPAGGRWSTASNLRSPGNSGSFWHRNGCCTTTGVPKTSSIGQPEDTSRVAGTWNAWNGRGRFDQNRVSVGTLARNGGRVPGDLSRFEAVNPADGRPGCP